MPIDLNCASGSSVKVNDLILYIKTRLKGDKGDEGARGLQGLQGVRGFTGVRGLQGIQGVDGHDGIQGVAGLGIEFKSSYDTLADLIAHVTAPEMGEAHLVRFEPDGVTVKGDLYVWSNPTPPHDPAGADWHDVGHVQGAQGIQGVAGHAGVQGDSIHIMGTETLAHILANTTPAEGNIWISTTIGKDESTPQKDVHIGDGIVFHNGIWQSFGQFRGNDGAQGAAGQDATAAFATHNEVVQATHATAAINTVEFAYPKQMMMKGEVPMTADWDILRVTGVYATHGMAYSSTLHNPNTGAALWGSLEIMQMATGWVNQRYTDPITGLVAVRGLSSNGWTPWKYTADQAWVNGKFLPLVGGTLKHPTGATIIQLNTVANQSNYIRGAGMTGNDDGWYVGRGSPTSDTLYLKSYHGDIIYFGTKHSFNSKVNVSGNITATGIIKGAEVTATSWVNIGATSGGVRWSARGGQITMVDTSWIRFNKSTHCTGNIAATQNIFAYYSDMRLKTKVCDIPNALDKVCSLTGFLYKRNELANSFGYKGDGLEVGVSAQDMKKVLPECVSLAPFDYGETDEDGVTHSKSGENYMTVDYAKITPLLIEAIKELKAEIEVLKAGR